MVNRPNRGDSDAAGFCLVCEGTVGMVPSAESASGCVSCDAVISAHSLVYSSAVRTVFAVCLAGRTC